MEEKIKLSRAQKILENIGKQLEGEDPDLTFEFFMATFYPDILNNIKLALNEEHTKGYIEGFKAGREDVQSNNSDI